MSYVVDLDRYYSYLIGFDHGQMNIYDNLTINGNGHFLDALGKCRIFSVTGDNVTLNNIVFRNGNTSGADGTLTDYENGGAILWSNGDNATINNCTFTNNIASKIGGALHITINGDVLISNSTFKYCEANYGSAIHCNGNNYDISLCDFINNIGKISCSIEWSCNYVNLYGSNITYNLAT